MRAEAMALDVARRIRARVHPLLGDPGARETHGTAHGGDPTYEIDHRAEDVVREAMDGIDDVAYFTEDEGLTVRGRPDVLYLIDPIDGTRPATAGYETCCATVAVAPYGSGVTLGDVSYGAIVELSTGSSFQARAGRGVEVDGSRVAPRGQSGLSGLFWGGGFRGQPAVALATVLEGLFDVPGSEGAFFDQGSAAYSLTRVATGQLDAYVDPGQAMVDTVPGMAEAFRRVGGGSVLNTTTYDTAAGYLLLWELGLPVTDAVGGALRDVPLLDGDGRASLVSTIAAATPELHARIVEAVGEGLERLRQRTS